MRAWMVLLAIGGVLAVLGLYLAASTQIQINEGNQCDVGCRNVAGSIPLAAPGMLLFVIGLLTAVYGFRKRGNEDE